MIRRWLRRRALVCRQAVALMSDYIDGALPERDWARLEHHLADCPHCTEYLAQLRATDEATLLELREVGRMKLPSNVLGLLFHAAEHTQRHVGQVIVAAKLGRMT